MHTLKTLLLFHLFISSASDQQLYLSYKELSWKVGAYTPSSLRSAVLMLEKLGMITKHQEEGRTMMRMTASGREYLFFTLPLLNPRRQRWDGFWRIAVFTNVVGIVEDRSAKYRETRIILTKAGFGQLERAVYVSPFPLSDQTRTQLSDAQVLGMMTIFETRRLVVGEDRLISSQVWNLETKAKQYTKISKRLQSSLTTFRKQKTLNETHKRQFLSVSKEFFSCITQDPGVPNQISPEGILNLSCVEQYRLLASMVHEFFV